MEYVYNKPEIHIVMHRIYIMGSDIYVFCTSYF